MSKTKKASKPKAAADTAGKASKKAAGKKSPTTKPQPKEEQLMAIGAEELERLRAIERHHVKTVSQNDEVTKLQGKYDEKKKAADEAKRALDHARDVLQEIIAESLDPQKHLEFEGKPLGKQVAANDKATAITTGWETVPIAALQAEPYNLTAGLIKALNEHGLKTIGKIEERRAGHGRALDLAGIAAKKAEKINDAVDAWLRDNRDKAVFDAAAKGGVLGQAASSNGAAPAEALEYFMVTEAIAMNPDLYPAGSIYRVQETMDDGSLVLVLTDDEVFSVKPNEGRYVKARSLAVRVRIVSTPPGVDASAGLHVGAEIDVKGHHDEAVLVEGSNGVEVLLPPAEFEAMTVKLVAIE